MRSKPKYYQVERRSRRGQQYDKEEDMELPIQIPKAGKRQPPESRNKHWGEDWDEAVERYEKARECRKSRNTPEPEPR